MLLLKAPSCSEKRWGLSATGASAASRRYCFRMGMDLLVYYPYVPDIDVNRVGRQKVDLETLLKESDFVSVHLKVTPETRGMIGEKAFKLMKPTAYFINCARAAVVDEEALIEALRNKEIAGAALDVFEKEPIYKNHPFITELDNVVITPHIAGATYEVLSNHTEMIIQEIRRFLNGEPLLYEYK